MTELLQPGITVTQMRTMETRGELPIAIEACIDCRSIYDALKVPDIKLPTEQSLVLILLQIKELMTLNVIKYITWINTFDMLSDGLNKGLVSRSALLLVSSLGVWKINHPCLQYTESRTSG